MGESANGLIVYALSYEEGSAIEPFIRDIEESREAIGKMREAFEVVFATDVERPRIRHSLEPYLHEMARLCYFSSLPNPVSYREIIACEEFAPFHDCDPQRCIVLSRELPVLKAAHEVGMHAIWLRGVDAPMNKSFLYRGENALGPLKSPLDHIDEITATWPPGRVELKTTIKTAPAKDPRPFVVN